MMRFPWWGVLLSACHILGGLCNVSGLWDEQPAPICGMENMQVVFPKHVKNNFKMKVLNKEGKMDVLRTDPSCNIWVSHKADGSIVIATAYDGCYVTRKETDYVLIIGLVKRQEGKKVTVRKDVRCSVESFHDAPSVDQCTAIPSSDRLKCSDLPDACATVGCCYDATDPIAPCYFGSAVTASCTPDGLFSIAISKTLTLPVLDLNSVTLLGRGAECNPVNENDLFLHYQFPLSSCGTKITVTGDQVVYENELAVAQSLKMWNGRSITRDTTFRLVVRCLFTVTGFLPLKVEVATLPPPLPVSSEGPLTFQMRIAIDSQYRDYYGASDYPVVRVLRDPVYVEVQILQKSDPNLILVLHQCWATPDTNPLNKIQWPILINGCPFTGDNYMSELVPVGSSGVRFPSHYSRFDLETFVFVDGKTQQPLGGQVYIHCSASACVPSQTDDCATTCFRRKRSTNLILDESETVLVSSKLPIYFENTKQEQWEDINGHGAGSSWPDSLINSAALTMGILTALLLALATWTIHRRQKCKSVQITKHRSIEAKVLHIPAISS